MTIRLFNRTYRLVIAKVPATGGFVGTNPQYFDKTGNAVEITEMAIKFTIKKNLSKNPNPCTITIYNLSADSRHSLENDVCQIYMFAGYDGVEKLLFAGDRRFGSSKQSRTEWETKVEVADGGRAFSFARMNRSYKSPIQVSAILKDCATSMGLSVPASTLQVAELKQQLATGQSLQGPTRDVLTRILAPYNYGWSMQNGVLQILRNQDVRPGTAFLVNQSTGLLGSPERETPDHKTQQNKIKFEVQLYPDLVPGASVKLESSEINGTFKIKEVVHEGETHGGDWKSKVVAEPVSA